MDYLQHFLFLNPMQCLINVIRKDKTLLADDPEAFQYLKFHYANPTCLHRQIPVCSDAKHPQFVFFYSDNRTAIVS